MALFYTHLLPGRYYKDTIFNDNWRNYLEKALIGSLSLAQMVVNLESEVNKAIA